MNWNKYPFLRLVMALSLGIVLRDAFGSTRVGFQTLFIVLMVLLGLEMLLFRLLRSYRVQWIYGVATLIIFAYLGFFRASLQDVTEHKGFYGQKDRGDGYCLARVCETPVEKGNSIKAQLELSGFRSDSLDMEISGKVMAYFSKTVESEKLVYGDMIAFSVSIGEVTPPLNPMEFDYKKYLERRGVTGRVYLKDGDWTPLGINKGNPIYSFAYRFRNRLLSALQRCGITEDEFGVAAAILLGDDESLPAQVRQNYVAAGSMHVLCVSGMHVGIIYLLASFLLGFLGKGKRVAFFRRLVLLLLIWFYALLTGLSPSVMRASLMISFVVFGELIHRKGFALNSIAASAFVLLLIDPNNLFAIGFQLSYVAVVGIVLLQRPIYNLLYIKNELLDKVWEITTVSLAAQLATMPFTLYYFQQFTPYFWLSNLFMTPLSFIVVISGMVLFLVSWIPYLNVLFGYVVWGSVYGMNAVVSWIESLPFSIVKGLYVSSFDFFMLLFAFLMLLLRVALRKQRLVIPMLSALLLMMLSVTVRLYQADAQIGMTVFSLRNHTAIDFVFGNEHVLLADTSLMADMSTVDYSLKGAWAKQNLSSDPQTIGFEEDFENDFLRKKWYLVSFDGKLLALWNDDCPRGIGFSNQVQVDYLLVTGKQKPDMQSVEHAFVAQLLIIDGSVPRYLAEQWVAQAQEKGMPCVDIGKGALRIER